MPGFVAERCRWQMKGACVGAAVGKIKESSSPLIFPGNRKRVTTIEKITAGHAACVGAAVGKIKESASPPIFPGNRKRA